MPFTLCHPAVVIPLHRNAARLTSLPGLVIGSMAPDFVYFFSLGVSGSFSHSMLGALMYCVPAGLFVYLIYFALIREPFLAWLPQAVSARMPRQLLWPLGSARSVCIVLGSLAIGAASHIFWDAFTHADTVFVHRDGLLQTAISLGGYEVPLFKVLQHLSSLVGFIVIAFYIFHWFLRSEPAAPYPEPLSTKMRFLARAAVGAAATAGGIAGLLLRDAASIERGLFNFIVTAMATATLAVVLLCVGWKVSRYRVKNS